MTVGVAPIFSEAPHYKIVRSSILHPTTDFEKYCKLSYANQIHNQMGLQIII